LIRIELRLFGELRGFVKGLELGEPKIMDVSERYTVGDLIKDLNIPSDTVKIILVNGRSRGEDYSFQQNDKVALFPPIAGG